MSLKRDIMTGKQKIFYIQETLLSTSSAKVFGIPRKSSPEILGLEVWVETSFSTKTQASSKVIGRQNCGGTVMAELWMPLAV